MDHQTQKDAAFYNIVMNAAKHEFRTIAGQKLTPTWHYYRREQMQKRIKNLVNVGVIVTMKPIDNASFQLDVWAKGYSEICEVITFENNTMVAF